MSDAVSAPPSRNSPCPCGSGRRYKDCHGALAGAGASGAAAPPRGSAYRAPGGEWAHLDESAKDLLGTRMERALELLMAGQVVEAAREYRDVIAAAPDTHDALHMLGVIELRNGNLDEAERLVAVAMRLRPPYTAIEHNRQLIEDARTAFARAQPEQLAERALPILVDLALSPGAATSKVQSPVARTGRSVETIHLIGRVHDGDHDDGWLLRRLIELLEADSKLVWGVDAVNGESFARHRVLGVDGAIGAVPRGGTHVFVGVDFECASWIERAVADRIVVFCQSAAPTRYLEQLRTIGHDGARPVELVFTSQAMADRFGLGHTVLPPLVEIQPPPDARPDEGVVYDKWLIDRLPSSPVGFVGQNTRAISEPDDGEFLSALGRIAGRLHIYDPGRFRYLMGGSAAVRFFERRPFGLGPFLAQLHCYIHRAVPWWQESAGRDVFGAMALGIPVLCPRESIHAERIEHGVDGFLYGSSGEAQQQLSDLRRAPALAAAVGRAAREKIRALAGGEERTKRYREFLRATARAAAPGTE